MTENHPHDGGHPTGINPEDATRWLQQLRAELASSVNGSLLRGARPVQVGNLATSGSATLRPTMSSGALVGYCFTSPVTTDSVVRITDRDGNLIALARLHGPAGELVQAAAWFGPGGINIPDGGIFVSADDDFEGVVYLRGSD